MEIFFVNCFCTDEVNSGNPAAVVLEFEDDDHEKQNLATTLDLPVTVFVTESNNNFPLLEFFYPGREMPLCLHGTLAAASILLNIKKSDQLTCMTKNRQKLNIAKAAQGSIQVQVSSQQVPEITIDKNEICQMLNLKDDKQFSGELPITIASVGSPKLLIPLISYNALAMLMPNFDLIKEWSVANRINGLYVYTPDLHQNVYNFYARGFNPKGGHNEDAATGVAAGALALSLQRNLIIGQGVYVKRPSAINVIYKNLEHIWIGGRIQPNETKTR